MEESSNRLSMAMLQTATAASSSRGWHNCKHIDSNYNAKSDALVDSGFSEHGLTFDIGMDSRGSGARASIATLKALVHSAETAATLHATERSRRKAVFTSLMSTEMVKIKALKKQNN